MPLYMYNSVIEKVLLHGGTCKCHADMLIQSTYLTDGPLLLQLCDRFLLNTEDNNVLSSDSNLYRKNI